MLFEIYNQNNIRVMMTENPDCIDNDEILTDMTKYAGYKFKLNGKVVSLSKIKELRRTKEL